MSVLIAAALLLLGPAAAPAPPSATPASEARDNDQDRIICRKTAVTGSRTDFVRECRTAREWNTRRSNIARGMREQLDRSFTGQPRPNAPGD